MIALTQDPPGFLYGSAYVFVAFGFSFFIRRSKLRRPERALGIGLAVAMILFMIVTNDVPQAVFIPCVLAEAAMLYGVVFFCNEMDRWKALYYTAHMYILGEFCASLGWQLFYYFYGSKEGSAFSFRSILGLYELLLVICILLFLLGRRMYHDKVDVDVTKRDALTVISVGVVIWSMSNLSYVPVRTPFSAVLPQEIFNIHTLVDLGGLAFFFAYHTLLIEVERRVAFDQMKSILDMQYLNYQISKQSVDIINQKYHDLKHQIGILRSEFGSEEGLKYLDKMQSEIETYEAQNKTGNKVLDTILTGKALYCQKEGIRMTCVADGSLLNFMDMIDLSSLFGNALENAIESVSAIEDPERRLIHVTVSRNNNFVRIKVENCYGGEIDLVNGLPETTKKDRNYHGFGIKSIKTIVKKYDGSVTISAKDGWFELRIIIPLHS